MYARLNSSRLSSKSTLAPHRAVAVMLLLTILRMAAPAQTIILAPEPPLPIITYDPSNTTTILRDPGSLLIPQCVDLNCTGNITITPADGWEAQIITAADAPAEYKVFAASAVTAYMAKKGLKPGSMSADGSDSGYKRFLISRRNEARAAVFLAILNAVYTPAFQRTPQEKVVVDYMAQQIKNRHIGAAEFALDEYQTWHNDPCNYTAPEGFKYERPDCSSSRTIADLFNFGYAPPPVHDYGVAYSFAELTAPQAVKALTGTAKEAQAMAASIAAGGAIGFAIPRVTPTLATQVSRYMLPYEEEDIADIRTIRLSFLRFAGPIGTMLSTLVDIVMVGIEVFEREKYGEKLTNALLKARAATVDLSVEVQKDKGTAELLGVFALGTLFNGPDPANIYAMPPMNALKLQVTGSHGGVGQRTPFVTYKTWDNSIWVASISPNGFFTHAKPGAEYGHTDTIINYVDWNGFRCSATYNHELRLFYFGVDGGSRQVTQNLQMSRGDGVLITLSVPAQPAPDYAIYLTSRLSGSPVVTPLDTATFPYVTKWGQKWTARRVGTSLWEHTPQAGGPSHVSNKLDLIMEVWNGRIYVEVPAVCEFRPAGSSTDFMCKPWDTTLPLRYVNTLDLWYFSTMYSVRTRP